MLTVATTADLPVVDLTAAETRVTLSQDTPGLLSLRELGPLVASLAKLRTRPDVLLVNGHGRAHPRRFGSTRQVGLESDSSTAGCARSRLTGQYDDPGEDPGDSSALTAHSEIAGMVRRIHRRSRSPFGPSATTPFSPARCWSLPPRLTATACRSRCQPPTYMPVTSPQTEMAGLSETANQSPSLMPPSFFYEDLGRSRPSFWSPS